MEFSILSQSLLVWVIISSLLYTIYGAVYRLFLSPISSFPGPKLAALTFWYEFYYDVILKGQYIWKIKALHEKYGPIVRINPYELHINDPDYHDTIFSNDRNAQKWAWGVRGFALHHNIFETVDPAIHRMRRTALNPHFSKQRALTLQPIVKERVDKLIERFEEFKDSGKIIHLDNAYAALANDVVMEYNFSHHDHKIEDPEFDPTWFLTNHALSATVATLKHLNFVELVMDHIPDWVTAKMHPVLAGMVRLKTGMFDQIKAIRTGDDKSYSESTHSTVFHDLFESKLPDSEKGTERLASEALLLIAAGTETTSWTLAIATFHLLSNPQILRKLKDELCTVDPTGGCDIPITTLQSLPYASAVVNEALRLSYGVTHRLQRVFSHTLEFEPSSLTSGKSWTIPANTPVSMSTALVHQNPLVFTDPAAFRPERWIEDPSLSRYQLAFSKGSRRCIGMNLATAELYTCIAAVFGKFGTEQVRGENDVALMELTGTDISDVELWGDSFLPAQKPGSLGVRVVVRSCS